MGIPFNFTQTIEVGSKHEVSADWQDRFLREAADKVKALRARSIRILGNRLEFLGPFFFFGRKTDLLTPITSGWIEITRSTGDYTIQYCLSFRRVFWLAVAEASIIFLAGGGNLPIPLGLLFVAFAWVSMFFICVVIRVWQFDRLIEEILIQSGAMRPRDS
jgi:hypothetical protein